MKCISYCTAERYDLSQLEKLLSDDGYFTTIFDNVIYIKIIDDSHTHEIFCFDYGCCVAWMESTANINVEDVLFSYLDKVSSKINLRISDTVFYNYADKVSVIEEDDTLLLTHDPLVKLSMSHALSQSVKLGFFEHTIIETIKRSRHLTDEFASKGKTSLSHHGLAQMIGQLFAARQSINLHTDILDIPEFFWRRPKYEPYYHMVTAFMDLSQRIQVLNQRLVVIQELYQMLSDELRHEHSSRLEWIIIILILFEVVLGFVSPFFKFM